MKPNLIVNCSLATFFLMSSFSCDSHQSFAKQEGNTFTVDLAGSVPENIEKFRIVEVDAEPIPALFQYILESDYIVVAERTGRISVQNRVKKADPPNSLNFEDWPGSVDTYGIEELLFSKSTFAANEYLHTNTTRSFKTYWALSDPNGYVNDNIRYLFFLVEIPKSDDVFKTVELDREKSYYRSYIGDLSIFPGPHDLMHGGNRLGRINLSSGRYPNLVDDIRQMCRALSPGKKTERIRNLQELTKSKDRVLQANAEYAIRFLSRQEEK